MWLCSTRPPCLHFLFAELLIKTFSTVNKTSVRKPTVLSFHIFHISCFNSYNKGKKWNVFRTSSIALFGHTHIDYVVSLKLIQRENIGMGSGCIVWIILTNCARTLMYKPVRYWLLFWFSNTVSAVHSILSYWFVKPVTLPASRADVNLQNMYNQRITRIIVVLTLFSAFHCSFL